MIGAMPCRHRTGALATGDFPTTPADSPTAERPRPRRMTGAPLCRHRTSALATGDFPAAPRRRTVTIPRVTTTERPPRRSPLTVPPPNGQQSRRMTGALLCRHRTSAHAGTCAIRGCFQVQLALVRLAFDSRDGRATLRGPPRRVTGTLLSCHAISTLALA